MNKILLTVFGTLIGSIAFANHIIKSPVQSGIQFETRLTWKEVVEKAKKENKHIFVDCYATWCGPCKKMSQDIFTQQEVGDYFNTNFINVSVQFDKTDKDSREIQAWYKDADSLASKFDIDSYPTYLFFSPNGNLLHRSVGSTEDAKQFIAIGKNALDPKNQYYTVIEEYKKHLDDSLYLIQALNTAVSLSDQLHAIAIGNSYFACLKNPLSEVNIDFIKTRSWLITNTRNKIFLFFINNAARIDSMTDNQNLVEQTLASAIFDEQSNPPFIKDTSRLLLKEFIENVKISYPTLKPSLLLYEKRKYEDEIQSNLNKMLYSDITLSPDWNKISSYLKKKYADYDCGRIFLEAKAKYHYKNKEFNDCEKSAYKLMRNYGKSINDFDINEFAWSFVFLHGKDPKALREAIKWMKLSVARVPDRAYTLDTYANLIYKAGYQREALNWEKKALLNLPPQGKITDNYKAHLDKMQKLLPTWLDDSPVKQR